MNTIYSLKPVYFNKLLLILSVGLFPAIVWIFLEVGPKNYAVAFAAISLLVMLVLVWIFYLSRNEVSTLIINDDVSVEYFNKSFFKKKPFRGNRTALTTAVANDLLYIYHNNTMLAIIRKSSIEEKEWQEIRTYFQV